MNLSLEKLKEARDAGIPDDVIWEAAASAEPKFNELKNNNIPLDVAFEAFQGFKPVGTSFTEEISQIPAALKQSFGQPLESMGETAEVVGFPAVGAALKGAIKEPEGYVTAGQRFMEPQEGEFQIAGFAPQYAPRAIAEQTGQILMSIGSRAVGAAAGIPLGPAGVVTGAFLGPALTEAAQIIGPVAKERARNNGYEEPTNEDIAYAAVTAAGSGALNAFGAKYLPGGEKAVGSFSKKLASSFLGEGIPEGLQSFVQQVGETVETQKGIQVSPKQAIGEALIGGGAGAVATTIAAPFTPEQIAEAKITESANKEAENLVIGNDNPQGKAVLANKQKLEQEIADIKQVLSAIESTDPIAQKLKLELKEKEAILAAAQGQVDSIIESTNPVVEAKRQQIELGKQIIEKPIEAVPEVTPQVTGVVAPPVEVTPEVIAPVTEVTPTTEIATTTEVVPEVVTPTETKATEITPIVTETLPVAPIEEAVTTEAPVGVTKENFTQQKETIKVLNELTTIDRAALSGRLLSQGLITRAEALYNLQQASNEGITSQQISTARLDAEQKWDDRTRDGILAGRASVKPTASADIAIQAENARRGKRIVSRIDALNPKTVIGMTARQALKHASELNVISPRDEKDKDAIWRTGTVVKPNYALMQDAAAIIAEQDIPILDKEKIVSLSSRGRRGRAVRFWSGDIGLPSTKNTKVETLVHEVGHTLTIEKIRQVAPRDKTGGKDYIVHLRNQIADTKIEEPIRRLMGLYISTLEQLGIMDQYGKVGGLAGTRNPDSSVNAARKLQGEGKLRKDLNGGQLYALANIEEFVSQAFSEPTYRDLLKTLKDPNTKKSIWREFVQAIKDLFGFTSDSMAAAVIEATFDIAKPTTIEESLIANKEIIVGNVIAAGINPEDAEFVADEIITETIDRTTGTFFEKEPATTLGVASGEVLQSVVSKYLPKQKEVTPTTKPTPAVSETITEPTSAEVSKKIKRGARKRKMAAKPTPLPDNERYGQVKLNRRVQSYFGGKVPDRVYVVDDAVDEEYEYKAAYYPDEGILIINNAFIRKNENIGDIIAHELGHYAFGDKKFKAAFDKFYNSLTPEEKAEIDQLMGDSYNNETEESQMEERKVIAFTSFTIATPQRRSLWNAVLDALKAFVNKVFGKNFQMSDPTRTALAMLATAKKRFAAGEEIVREDIQARKMAAQTQDARFAELEARAKAGDKEAEAEAQRMVDEAAKKAGYDVGPVWHGSPDFVGNEFDLNMRGRRGFSRGGFSFTREKRFAEAYMQSGVDPSQKLVDEINSLMRELQKRINSGFEWVGPYNEVVPPEFKADAVDDISDVQGYIDEISSTLPIDLQVVSNELATRPSPENFNPNPRLIRAFLKEPKIIDVSGKELLLAEYPAQIKSADPFTYDDAGALIPLSERFQPTTPDIRRMAVEPEQGNAPIKPEAKTITEGLVQGIDIGKETNMPINNKIESHIKNFSFVRGIFESASDRLRRAKFTKLATAIDDYYDQAQRRLGFANKILLPAFEEYSKQSKATKAKIDEEVKMFFAAQENKRDTDQFFDELNPITQKIVTSWQKFGEESGNENKRIGIKVYDKGLQRWRPIGRVDKFWPRVLKPEYKRALMEPDKYQKEYNEIVEALMKSGRIENPEEAEVFISEYEGTGSKNDYFSGIETARGQAFPEELYDYSTQVMTDYVARWAQHSSRIEQFGQKLGENSMTLWDKSRASTRDRRTIDYITAAQERVEGYYPNDPIVKGMAILNIWSSGLQLGNPASSLLNFFGGTALNAMVGQPGAFSSYLSSFVELRKLGKELKDAREKGIVSRDLMNIVGDHQVVLESNGLAKAGQKTTDFLLKWSGFTPIEQMVRTQSMIIGKSFLRKTLSSLSKNPNSTFSKRSLAWLNRNSIDADKLIVEKGSGPETDKLLRYFANISQGSYTIAQTPIFTDTPIGRFLFKYQKFSTQVMRQSWKNTFEPAWKAVTNKNEMLQLPDPTRQLLYRLRLAEAKELGDNRKITLDEIPKKVTKAEGKALTIIPVMMWLGSAYVGGEIILRMRDMLFGVLMKGPSYEDIIRAFEDDEDDDELYLALERAWYNLIGMGALGLIGNYAQFFMDWQDRERVKNPLDPPALSIAKETGTFIQNAADQGKITVGDVNNYLNRTLSAYRVSQRLYQTAASKLGFSKAPTVAEEMFRRETAVINKYARRWAESAGLEYRTKRPMDIAPSKMTSINREIASYLQRGEPGAAVAYAKEYLNSLPKSERKNAIQSMESGARFRQPFRLGNGPMDKSEKKAFTEWLKEKVSKVDFDKFQKLDKGYKKSYDDFLRGLPNK
jgi:hypothetical protein